jgi:uncharacterized protein (DUF362 family)
VKIPIVAIYDISKQNLNHILLEGLKDIKYEKIISSTERVLIKPNLTWPHYKKGVTTSPRFLDVLTQILRPQCSKLFIGESDGANRSWTAEEAFHGHNLYKIAKKNDVELVNLTNKPTAVKTININNDAIKIELSKFLLDEVDVLITVPVLKIHASTGVSLGLKNQWGCIPDPMRLLYHPILHEGIVEINKIYNPQISIIDATYALNNSGPIYGTPVKLYKFLISNNVVALDMMACSFMGIPLKKVYHIYLAVKELLTAEQNKNLKIIGDFNGSLKFELNKNLMDKISNFIMFHKYINEFFYNSKFSGVLHKFSHLYKILINKEIPSAY